MSRYIGCTRGHARRMFLRGRLGCAEPMPGNHPRGVRRFRDSAELRWQLEQVRQHHRRPDKRWQQPTAGRKGRLRALARIVRGEQPADDQDKLAGQLVLRALILLWGRIAAGEASPVILGALELAPSVRARHRRGCETLLAELMHAADGLAPDAA